MSLSKADAWHVKCEATYQSDRYRRLFHPDSSLDVMCRVILVFVENSLVGFLPQLTERGCPLWVSSSRPYLHQTTCLQKEEESIYGRSILEKVNRQCHHS